MRGFGVDPARVGDAVGWLDRLRGFVELHIDQTQDLARIDAAAGSVRSLAARLRLALRFLGRADHAGTTRRSERRDALAAAARVIVLADELAGGDEDFLVTASRLLVEPNAFTTVPAEVRLWIDARTPDGELLSKWRGWLAEAARGSGVEVEVSTASHSDAVEFDPGVRGALGDIPELVCFAGHDAGILAPRIPAGMVFVRNATGVSHSPDEQVELDDAAVAAEALRSALESLATRRVSPHASQGSIR
jgi:beta-ureidopropionase / N-carbamoyl-L-amino-acid hydrolase